MAFPQLVTFQQTKRQLRVDHDIDDTMIEELIDQASAIVLTYISQTGVRTTYQSLPVLDPLNPPTPISPWPWAWPLSSVPPYWWPATRISYQQLPPYIANTWFAGSPADPTTVPFDVQAATIVVIQNRYDKPHEDPLSTAVKSLLAMHRDPAMA